MLERGQSSTSTNNLNAWTQPSPLSVLCFWLTLSPSELKNGQITYQKCDWTLDAACVLAFTRGCVGEKKVLIRPRILAFIRHNNLLAMTAVSGKSRRGNWFWEREQACSTPVWLLSNGVVLCSHPFRISRQARGIRLPIWPCNQRCSWIRRLGRTGQVVYWWLG